ncbi:hypothetical protein [Novacetimonas cocois]|uniref:hypothetical protein n=1 Tax=Novacetimonas cocois TaxID=1747507 RepID=UPI001057A40F|nr:hypothetical protein [Novacetimonas cocois]
MAGATFIKNLFQNNILMEMRRRFPDVACSRKATSFEAFAKSFTKKLSGYLPGRFFQADESDRSFWVPPFFKKAASVGAPGKRPAGPFAVPDQGWVAAGAAVAGA